jgi:Mce-associated membrane protein
MIKLKKKSTAPSDEPVLEEEALTEEEVLDEDLGEQLAIELPEAEVPEEAPDATDSEADKPTGKVAFKAARKVAKPSRLKLSRPVGNGVPVWVTAVLGAITIGLAVGVFMLSRSAGDRLSQDDVDNAVRTAGLTAQHVTSFDYKTLEADTKQVLEESTGKFHDDYEANAKQLLSAAPAEEAVSVGQASKYGVEAVRGDQVTVLVFLNQSTARKGKETKIELRQLRMTMVKGTGAKSDQWLVSRLDVL